MTHQPNNVSAAGVSDDDRALNSLVISTASETGLHVRIDGKMLNDNYTNVTGSFPALVRFSRALLAAASAQATGQAVPEGWKAVPVKLTPNMAEAYRAYWSNTQNIYGAWTAMLAAAPYPAAREAGDGVISSHAIEELFFTWSEWTTELGEAIPHKHIDGFVSDLRALLREVGSGQ